LLHVVFDGKEGEGEIQIFAGADFKRILLIKIWNPYLRTGDMGFFVLPSISFGIHYSLFDIRYLVG